MEFQRRIPEDQWSKIYEYLKDSPRIHTNNSEKIRRFVEAVFWIVRSGAQWRLVPPEYGNWNVIYQRFSDWAEQGIWYKMLYYFADRPDMEYIMIDSTILRAHACAAGAQKKTRGARKSIARKVKRRVFNKSSWGL